MTLRGPEREGARETGIGVLPPQAPSPDFPRDLLLLATGLWEHFVCVETLLARIADRLDRQVPQGRVNTYVLNGISATYFTNEIIFEAPAFSVTLINDGPAGAIDYRIPYRGQRNTGRLNAGEDITFNFREGSVLSVGVQAVGTDTPNVRITVQY